MRYCCVLLLGLLVSMGAKGQGFSKLYTEGRPGIRFTSMEVQDGYGYLTGLTAAIDTPHYLKSLFCQIDSGGNVLFFNGVIDSLPFSYEVWFNTLHKATDGNFVACGDMQDGKGKAFVVKFDTTGQIVFFTSFTDTTWQLFSAKDVVDLGPEGFLLVLNVVFMNNSHVVLVIRTDTLGNVLSKKIHDYSYREIPQVMRPMLNGNFMVGLFAETDGASSFGHYNWFLEIDSMGNKINVFVDSANINIWPEGMQQTIDSGWIVVRQHITRQMATVYYYNASIVKYDKKFIIEWQRFMGDSGDRTGFRDVEILPDGKYVACGTTPIWGTDSAYHYGWVVKFDTDGTVLWDRKFVAYQAFNTHSYLNDIDVLPNGDLLACGELLFYWDIGIRPKQQGWILRLDSNGCEIENCILSLNPSPKERDLNSQLQLYPNPANSNVQVMLGNEFMGGTLKLYNTTGALVKQVAVEASTISIDISALPKGLYFVAAEKEGGSVKGKLVVE